MTDIDATLDRLRMAAVHPALAEIDDAVLMRVRLQSPAGSPHRASGFVVAALVALGLGIAGSFVPGTPAQAAASPAPFGTPPALAPSTLLGGN
jgi:hypothetical protein